MSKTVEYIQSKSQGANPTVGIILGSGLGSFVNVLESPISLSYNELDGFPDASVSGHEGKLHLGKINHTEIAVLQGRAHYYETGVVDAMKIPVRTLAGLGCESLILTNAAGSLMEEAQPGSVMAITDHINFTGVNPLFAEGSNNRFVDMADAYNSDMRSRFHKIADDENIKLHQGIYIWFCGPSFETPAEIQAAKMMGANAVGMSTVPEVILARHAGMKVAALSVMTNMAAGMSDEVLNHELTMENAAKGIKDLKIILVRFLELYS